MINKLIAVKIYQAKDKATGEVSLFGVTKEHVVVIEWNNTFHNTIKRRRAVEDLLASGFVLTKRQTKRMVDKVLFDDYTALLLVPEKFEA